MKPYGLLSDLHCHGWSAFSTVNSQGVNSRLLDIIREIDRCCDETLKAGGDTVVIAGDLFHTRGSVDPEVFNPVKECLSRNILMGINRFRGIPGNHDLKSKDSVELGSSVQMLGNECIHWYHQPESRGLPDQPSVYVPWVNDPTCYLSTIEDIARNFGTDAAFYDLIIHLGIAGTLTSGHDNGITAERLREFGFKRVFSGHYHNHKDFGDGIYSIGASTHQTWSDVGTKAGFMVVYHDRVQWFASHAPSFIDLTGAESEEDLPLIVDGHFVRAKIGEAEPKQVQEWREKLLSLGAKGVIIQSQPASAAAKRVGVSAKSLSALDKSVTDYVSERGMPTEVGNICAEILGEVKAAA